MPKWITAIFVFFLSTTLLTARAITVEDVIRKHVEVMALEVNNDHKYYEAFVAYHRKGYKAKLEGIETVNGKPCYNISFNHVGGNKIHYLIDAKTWFVTRRSVSVFDKSLKATAIGDRNIPNNINRSSTSGQANN